MPRERFLPRISEREGLERVYENQAIVTAHDERGIGTSSSSQPSMMASMLEQLDLRPGQRAREPVPDVPRPNTPPAAIPMMTGIRSTWWSSTYNGCGLPCDRGC